MASNQSNSRIGVVQQGCQQGIEAIRVSEDIGVGLLQFQACAPELIGNGGDDNRTRKVGPHKLGLDVAQGRDNGLRKVDCEPVLGRFVHSQDVDARPRRWRLNDQIWEVRAHHGGADSRSRPRG